MKRTWLIQRLHAPVGYANPFSFGGGLRNGGLSEEAMGILKSIFSFAYIGSAEFEWGAVPKAFQALAEQKLCCGATELMDHRVFYICPSDIENDVVCRIAVLHEDEGALRLKEFCGLKQHFIAEAGTCYKDVKGWLELDNPFMFFADHAMYLKVCEVFGLKAHQ